jgi:hypothetical protein
MNVTLSYVLIPSSDLKKVRTLIEPINISFICSVNDHQQRLIGLRFPEKDVQAILLGKAEEFVSYETIPEDVLKSFSYGAQMLVQAETSKMEKAKRFYEIADRCRETPSSMIAMREPPSPYQKLNWDDLDIKGLMFF